MKQVVKEEELLFGLVLIEQCLFAEFFFHDDFNLGLSIEQRMMFCDLSPRVCLCCGRKVGKTAWLQSRIVQAGLIEKGEGMIVTPGANHINPVRNRVESCIAHNPLFNAFQTRFNRAEGIQVWRSGGWTWFWRIEGKTGTDTNMAGLRASIILGDEMAYSTMVCHNSRELVALPKCKWLYAGVPNQWRSGVLYVIDKTTRGHNWSRHKIPTYGNPLFRGQEKELIANYKGEHTSEYQTQVLGEWGDELARTFPPGAVAQNTAVPFWMKAYNYTYLHLFTDHPSANYNLNTLLNIPKVSAKRYAMGIDYGYSPDPTEIIVAYEGQDDCWYELMRLQLIAVPYHIQARIVHMINERLDFQLIGIGVEYVGAGLNIAQELQRKDTIESYSTYCDYNRILINSNPGGTIDVPVVDPTDILVATAKELGVPYIQDTETETVKLRRKNWMTEIYRDAMIRANNNFPGLKFWIASDEDLIESTINVAEKRTQTYVVYDKLDKDIPDHPVDAARNLMCAIVEGQSSEKVSALPVMEYGWAGKETEWRVPW